LARNRDGAADNDSLIDPHSPFVRFERAATVCDLDDVKQCYGRHRVGSRAFETAIANPAEAAETGHRPTTTAAKVAGGTEDSN
jgi:hypothetical protein